MISQIPVLVSSLLPLLSLLTSVSASCIHGTHLLPRQSETVPISNFGYSGNIGPLNWVSINETANALCSLGRFQSPINIDASIELDNGTSSTLRIPDVEEADFENLGTTVEVVVNGTLVDRGKEYALAQFHFHTPSEHRVFGEYQAMEAHFVFQAEGESSPALWTSSSLSLPVPTSLSNTMLPPLPDSTILVLAFLIRVSGQSELDPLFGSIFTALPAIRNPGSVTATGPLSFARLENHFATHSFYRYEGSLTTPPCSEGVEWLVVDGPLLVDVGTLEDVKSVIGFNSRYTQTALGERNLLN
ncbi:MAG: hypothetical protein Q9187_004985 [Circinaria calcarea]